MNVRAAMAGACAERRQYARHLRRREQQVVYLWRLKQTIERGAQCRLRLRDEIDRAETRADLLIGDQQAGVIVTQSDLRRQIAQWRKLVLRVERELSAHAPVTKQKRIVL